MLTRKYLLFLYLCLFTVTGCLLTMSSAISSEEPAYTIVQKTDVYEIRRYSERTVAEVTYEEQDSGFRILFDYISGGNKGSNNLEMTIPVTQSEKIDMTVPVTQSNAGSKISMRFFLPKQYSKQNAPEPNDKRVKIIDLPEEYFAVITYSGSNSDSSFKKWHQKLRSALSKDDLRVTGPPVKATYNSPFTLPFLRRNEAMYPLKWN